MQDLIQRLEQIAEELEEKLEEYPDWDLQNGDERFKAEQLGKALSELDLVIFCLKMID